MMDSEVLDMNQVLEEYARTGLILEGVECQNAKGEPDAQGAWVHSSWTKYPDYWEIKRIWA